MCFVPNQQVRPAHYDYDSDDSSTSSSSSDSDAHDYCHNMPIICTRHMMIKFWDAVFYLERVKQYFCHQPYVYHAFLNTMQAYKNGQITTSHVVTRVIMLLRNKPELLVQFNQFLPVDHQIVFRYYSG